MAKQSVSENKEQTPEPGNEQSLFVRRAFAYDPSAATWLKMDRLDFPSTTDLRMALCLPGEENR